MAGMGAPKADEMFKHGRWSALPTRYKRRDGAPQFWWSTKEQRAFAGVEDARFYGAMGFPFLPQSRRNGARRGTW